MNFKWLAGAATLVALLGNSIAQAQSENRGVELLQAIEQKYGNVPSVTGAFTQRLHEPGFGAGKAMQANFSLLKPSDFKIEYAGAEADVTLVTGGHLYKYVPKLKQATKHKLKQDDLHYLALGFGARTSEIQKTYNIKSTEGGRGIQLTPKNSKSSQFKNMTISVDTENLVPEKFTVEQSDGSKTELAINKSTLQFGGRLSARDFKPNFPRDVQTVDME